MKKGFTLIELLAVIVILAVIALIVTPIVSGIINRAKLSANLRSAEGYVTAVKTRLISNMLDSDKLDDGLYTVSDLETKKVTFSGSKPTSGDVAILNGAVVSADLVFNGSRVNVNSFGVASASFKTYGLRWDGTNYTRLNDSSDMDSCVGTDELACVSNFDSAEIYNEIHDVNVNGSAFVFIPKFYIKKIVSGNNFEWYISKSKQDGYYLPECFHDLTTDRELPYVLVGKYDATISDDNSHLESKTGVLPLVDKNISEFRTLAASNNTGKYSGYQLLDIHTLDVLQVLFYVEYGTLNSQSLMAGYTAGLSSPTDFHNITSIDGNNITVSSGEGSTLVVGQLIDIASSLGSRDVASNVRITAINGNILTVEDTPFTVRRSSTAVNNIVYGVPNVNGKTDGVKASSGSDTSNTDSKHNMKYRGIENLYGNVWQFIDGVNINNTSKGIFVNRNPLTYASDVFSDDYVSAGYNKLDSNGYVTKMGYSSSNPFVQFPSEVSTTDNTKYGDYYKQSTEGNSVVMFGGCFNTSDSSGMSFYNNMMLSSDYAFGIGSRLVKKVI